MKIRGQLLTHSMMTPIERRMGRFMRAPDGHDGGDSTPDGDNPGGNSGDSSVPGGDSNNSGQSIDPASFWTNPDANNSSDQNGNNNDSGTPEDVGKTVAESIANFKAPLFTKEIGEQLAEGNLEGANAHFQTLSQQMMQQAVIHSTRIMQAFGADLLKQIRSEIDGKFTSKDDAQTLEQAFPSMRDPAMRPVINGIFQQSLRHSNGDRSKALEMTRDMLKTLGKTGQKDFGIEPGPSGDDDYLGDGPSNLVESLLNRQ